MYKYSFIFLCLTAFNIAIGQAHKQADMLVFSYDRPLQLYSFLESVRQFCTELGTVTVLYRASSESYDQAYKIIAQEFDHIQFVQQQVQKTNNFRELTLELVRTMPGEYIVFAVDDIIVKDAINAQECIFYLEQTQAYGFYLRLGTHLSQCYPHCKLGLSTCKQPVPPYSLISDKVLSWHFTSGSGDWCYPNTLDMTVYKKSIIYPVLAKLLFNSPNTLEEQWAQKFPENIEGLCYVTSKIVNIPLNKVQQDQDNPHMNLYTPSELLEIFSQGFKIDRAPLYAILNKAAHIEYTPVFITRESARQQVTK